MTLRIPPYEGHGATQLLQVGMWPAGDYAGDSPHEGGAGPIYRFEGGPRRAFLSPPGGSASGFWDPKPFARWSSRAAGTVRRKWKAAFPNFEKTRRLRTDHGLPPMTHGERNRARAHNMSPATAEAKRVVSSSGCLHEFGRAESDAYCACRADEEFAGRGISARRMGASRGSGPRRMRISSERFVLTGGMTPSGSETKTMLQVGGRAFPTLGIRRADAWILLPRA